MLHNLTQQAGYSVMSRQSSKCPEINRLPALFVQSIPPKRIHAANHAASPIAISPCIFIYLQTAFPQPFYFHIYMNCPGGWGWEKATPGETHQHHSVAAAP